MARRPFIRVFRNEETLRQMLDLRRQGWSYHALGRLYGVDHTSIRHWCVMFNLAEGVIIATMTLRNTRHVPSLSQKVSVVRVKTTDPDWEIDENGERVRKAKSYAQILAESKARSRQESVKSPYPSEVAR